MKKLAITWVLCSGLSACGNNATTITSNPALAIPSKPPVVVRRDTLASIPLAVQELTPAKVEALTKDFDTWYRYTYYNVPLSRDFKARDVKGQVVPKKPSYANWPLVRCSRCILGTSTSSQSTNCIPIRASSAR